MNILLTGHEGYLGSRLYQYFREQGHTVHGYGRREDINTITRTIIEKKQIQLVVNCATAANRTDLLYDFGGLDEQVNVFGTRRLVEALKNTNLGLIHLSTKDVYGNVYSPEDVTETPQRIIPKFSINEKTPFSPLTVYAKTKLMGEFIAESHPKTTIVRLSSGYTSHAHNRGNWILGFCRAAKKRTSVQIYGSGKQLRDPLHADDLAALLLLIENKNAWGYKINAGGGMESSYSILEVLNMIDSNLPRTFFPGSDLGYVTDNALSEKLTGWKPTLSLQAELRVLLERLSRE